jgi:hypothetical protein
VIIDFAFRRVTSAPRLGFVQFIESQALQRIGETHRSIRHYLQSRVNPNQQDENTVMENGLPRETMDAYVRSCGTMINELSIAH